MRKVFFILTLLFTMLLQAQVKEHVVQPKETVYGLSRQYGISQRALIKANPFLNERELQAGDELVIPLESVILPEDSEFGQEADIVNIPIEDENFKYIKIEPKQTVYSLTKALNITESALISLNPQLKDGLKAGDVIRVPKKKDNNNNEVVVPKGMHLVQKGETVYSLSKQFKVTEDDIYAVNPIIQKEGLKTGSFIKIPNLRNKTVIQNGFIEHTVSQGETIYSITTQYQVTLDELIKYNPTLVNGLQSGMVLKIPLDENANIIKVPTNITRVEDNKINLALLLPLYLDSNKNDREKAVAMDVLIGAKVALNTHAQNGKKIYLKVIDSQDSTGGIESLIIKEDFSKYDAVVGPLFTSNLKVLADILSKSNIPIISPISNNTDLEGYKNVVIATPKDEFLADRIIEKLKEDYNGEVIYILTNDRDEELAKYTQSQIQQLIPNAQINLTKNVDDLKQPKEKVKETLEDETEVEQEYFTPIITILVSDNNLLGDAYVKKLRTFNAENLKAYGVKYVSAYNIFDNKNKTTIEALKNIGFYFSTVRLVDTYGAKEKAIIKQFQDVYCAPPNEYQQIGYDVVYDLVDRMNNNGDLWDNIYGERKGLATKFEYKKVGDAYVNESVRVVHLFNKTEEEIAEEVTD